MAVSVVCAAPAGALADRFGGKRLLFFGAAVSGLGYGSLAFVTHPWQAFLGSAVAGVGAGCTQPAAGALVTALCTREERIAAFTVARIAINARHRRRRGRRRADRRLRLDPVVPGDLPLERRDLLRLPLLPRVRPRCALGAQGRGRARPARLPLRARRTARSSASSPRTSCSSSSATRSSATRCRSTRATTRTSARRRSARCSQRTRSSSSCS